MVLPLFSGYLHTALQVVGNFSATLAAITILYPCLLPNTDINPFVQKTESQTLLPTCFFYQQSNPLLSIDHLWLLPWLQIWSFSQSGSIYGVFQCVEFAWVCISCMCSTAAWGARVMRQQSGCENNMAAAREWRGVMALFFSNIRVVPCR